MPILVSIIAVIMAYLIGSLSSAILVCKLMRLPDPRTLGSHNPGATNVLRIAGKVPAIITLLGDLLKGFIPVLLAKSGHLNTLTIALIAFAAFLGHLFPVFFRFAGGKGVATLLGCLLALSPLAGISWIITWLIVAIVFRYSSLAALTASVLAPFYTGYFTQNDIDLAVVALMSLILILRHKNNIVKLLAGQETKIGRKKV